MLGTILTVPDTALLFRAQGLQVGILNRDNTVELRDINVGRDFATTIEVTSGVSRSDEIVNNPLDSLVSGEAIRVSAARTVHHQQQHPVCKLEGSSSRFRRRDARSLLRRSFGHLPNEGAIIRQGSILRRTTGKSSPARR